jgi:hypothetical protein
VHSTKPGRKGYLPIKCATSHRVPFILHERKPGEIYRGTPCSDPEAATRKLLEIAGTVEAMQDGRIFIELINGAFLL